MIQISLNTKLEVALEILAAKIAKMSKEGYTVNDEQMKLLINERNKLYSCDEATLDKIIKEYGPEIKEGYKNIK